MDIRYLILLFMIYSFLGWIVDILGAYSTSKKLVNRGFLIGPCCPIYGCGAIAITIFLQKYQNDTLSLFVMSCLLCAIIEYLTGYLMEKIFKTRWWDYSDKPFNLEGRICLSNTIAFGFLGFIVLHFLNPLFLNILYKIPLFPLNMLVIVLLVIFILDVIVSFNIISKIKDVDLDGVKDATEIVNDKVKEVLKNTSFLHKRLVQAFPDFKIELTVNLKYVNLKEIDKNIKKLNKKVNIKNIAKELKKRK